MKINFQPANFQNKQISPSFKAIPLAQYKYLNDKDKNVIVYELEQRDTDYLKHISDNIDGFYKRHDINDESTKQVVKEAVDASIEILNNEQIHPDSKSKVLLALSDKEASAILIGNVLKSDKNGNLHYSSRKNHSKDETELDWLATWNKNILGEGKVIVDEYFHTLAKDGFKQVYVRSEIPEKSFAMGFYKKMGFEPLSDEQREIQRKNDNGYIIGDYDALEDNIIPMKATSSDVDRIMKLRDKELKRKPIEDPFSVSLPFQEL